MDNLCPNCDRGLIKKTNEFCTTCAGTGYEQATTTAPVTVTGKEDKVVKAKVDKKATKKK